MILIWAGCKYRQTWDSWIIHSFSPPTTTADTLIFDLSWIDGPPSFLEQIADGINFPVTILAGLVAVPLTRTAHSGAEMELIEHVVTAIFIPVFWYSVGSFIDRRRMRRLRDRILFKGITVLMLIMASCLVLLWTVSLFHENGWLIEQLLAMTWSLVAIVCLSRTMRDWRRSKSQLGGETG